MTADPSGVAETPWRPTAPGCMLDGRVRGRVCTFTPLTIGCGTPEPCAVSTAPMPSGLHVSTTTPPARWTAASLSRTTSRPGRLLDPDVTDRAMRCVVPSTALSKATPKGEFARRCAADLTYSSRIVSASSSPRSALAEVWLL
eukprot:scaffold26628_cov33-Tisochrysis_lutea.AAC.2